MAKSCRPSAINKILIKDSFIPRTFIEHLIYAKSYHRYWEEAENKLYIKIIRMTLKISYFFILFIISTMRTSWLCTGPGLVIPILLTPLSYPRSILDFETYLVDLS